MNGPAIVAWILSSIPAVAVSAVAAYRLFNGGSAWWLLAFVFAAFLLPEAEK